jgi:rhomboid protease GluP
MADFDWLLRVLDRLGVNTTRLKWRIYQWEKRLDPAKARIPARLHWLTYRHKHCLNCGALLDRDERICRKCHRRVPSLVGYRLFRLFGIVVPQGSPIVVGGFVFVMVLVFVLGFAMEGVSAMARPSNYALKIFGAWSWLWAMADREYWRYLSFGLCHAGALHIGFNTFALIQVGPVIEERIGRWRMLAVITVTQVAAGVASLIWYYYVKNMPTTPTVGASGWLFGVIGFGIGHFSTQVGVARDYRNMLIQWAVYALLFGFVIGANNAAHVGGLVAGLALAALPEQGRGQSRPVRAIWSTAAGASALAWLVTGVFLAHSIATGWADRPVPRDENAVFLVEPPQDENP